MRHKNDKPSKKPVRRSNKRAEMPEEGFSFLAGRRSRAIAIKANDPDQLSDEKRTCMKTIEGSTALKMISHLLIRADGKKRSDERVIINMASHPNIADKTLSMAAPINGSSMDKLFRHFRTQNAIKG